MSVFSRLGPGPEGDVWRGHRRDAPPCRRFAQTGQCPFGERCRFAHSGRLSDLSGQAICQLERVYGRCSRPGCSFLHKGASIPRSGSFSRSRQSSASKRSAQGLHSPPRSQPNKEVKVIEVQESLLSAPLAMNDFVAETSAYCQEQVFLAIPLVQHLCENLQDSVQLLCFDDRPLAVPPDVCICCGVVLGTDVRELSRLLPLWSQHRLLCPHCSFSRSRTRRFDACGLA